MTWRASPAPCLPPSAERGSAFEKIDSLRAGCPLASPIGGQLKQLLGAASPAAPCGRQQHPAADPCRQPRDSQRHGSPFESRKRHSMSGYGVVAAALPCVQAI